MRTVRDTNILARAAAGFPGLAHELLLQATRPPHTLILSAFLVAELGRVLRYERVRRLHGFSERQIDEFVSDLILVADVVEVHPEAPAVVSPDPNDDPVVATAIDGSADYLGTLDRHLLRSDVVAYCQLRGVQILNDFELLAILLAASPPLKIHINPVILYESITVPIGFCRPVHRAFVDFAVPVCCRAAVRAG